MNRTEFKRGTRRLYWEDVRHFVQKIEPNLTKIIDHLSPNKKHPMYLCYYPYGAIDADTKSTLFPDNEGCYFRLTDECAPKEMVKDLGYSVNNTPCGAGA